MTRDHDDAEVGEVTRLLAAAATGSSSAEGQLLDLVYDLLRRRAAQHLARETAGLSFQATDLLHDAYLRIFGGNKPLFENRRHFYGAASRAMRRILVERARSKHRLKRGGNLRRVSLDAPAATDPDFAQVLSVDHALAELHILKPEWVQVVELRYFCGMTIMQSADALGVAPGTIKNRWNRARAWLEKALKEQAPPKNDRRSG